MRSEAVEVVEQIVREEGTTLHAWCLKHRLDPAMMSKFTRGKQGLSLKNALRLQEATGGRVTPEMCGRGSK